MSPRGRIKLIILAVVTSHFVREFFIHLIVTVLVEVLLRITIGASA